MTTKQLKKRHRLQVLAHGRANVHSFKRYMRNLAATDTPEGAAARRWFDRKRQ